MSAVRVVRACALFVCMWALSACTPGIGDSCDSALVCSWAGTRLCDQTQPGGYCTLADCQPGTCPTDSVCVAFWTKVPGATDTDMQMTTFNRLTTSYCMATCSSNGDCRKSDGYECVSGQQFGATGGEAQVLDNPNQKFCAARPQQGPMLSPDAGVPSEEDAGAAEDAGP